MIMYHQGKWKESADATVSIHDRGLVFGDGIYEVIRVYNGAPLQANEHMHRFFESAKGLSLPLPYNDIKDYLFIFQECLERNALTEGFLYVQLTRGEAPRSHVQPANPTPTFTVYTQPFTRPIHLHEEGIRTITHPDERWLRCHIKSLNLLPNTLARTKAEVAQAGEAILLRDNTVTEGSLSNVFMVIEGTLVTHPANTRILNGITRQTVLQLAETESLPISIRAASSDELFQASEVFITSTNMEIVPVNQIDQHVVGDGKPGPLTRRLQHSYEAYLGL
ncbi:hypothetical protein Q75_17150 [Bacillus coahuilensis p1.1.43]|uniref:D-alanine aminotransferase n=2 Tax=Bacillus coahuilensis TaxID=408580 RepID=A0A147K426_9BACI|nr:hypothetical protein Q75_17150 [Bacillus coahuilensis p1.1.43]